MQQASECSYATVEMCAARHNIHSAIHVADDDDDDGTDESIDDDDVCVHQKR